MACIFVSVCARNISKQLRGVNIILSFFERFVRASPTHFAQFLIISLKNTTTSRFRTIASPIFGDCCKLG